jgi:hypothetical protein
VYHEAMLEKRGSATVRQRSSVLGDREARAARGRGESRTEKADRQGSERSAMEAKAGTAPEQGELLADDSEDEPT